MLKVDTLSGCCERLLIVGAGRDGRELEVCGNVVNTEVPVEDDDGTVGMGICLSI